MCVLTVDWAQPRDRWMGSFTDQSVYLLQVLSQDNLYTFLGSEMSLYNQKQARKSETLDGEKKTNPEIKYLISIHSSYWGVCFVKIPGLRAALIYTLNCTIALSEFCVLTAEH